MSNRTFHERKTHPSCYDQSIPMRQCHNESNSKVLEDPTGNHIHVQAIHDHDVDPNGIDITKSLYHLRLHGFDIVAKNHDANTRGNISPVRIACVTPAVSPVHDVYSYRKRPSHLHLAQTVTIGSRPLSPQFLEMTPPRVRRATVLAQKEKSSFPAVPVVATKVLSDKINEDNIIIGTPKKLVKPKNMTSLSSNIDGAVSKQFVKDKSFQRLRSTTIEDGVDEFEVMLESSVSSDDDEDEEYHLRNESSIMDSPQSLPSFVQNDNTDTESFDNQTSTISPQTPSHLSFCGIPSWCETTTATTSKHLFLDDSSTPTVFQLHHRSTHEWFLCPTTTITTGCCVTNTNDTDTNVVHPESLQMAQHMLQNHICVSLSDSLDALCWQKSATSMFSKSSSIPINSISPLSSANEDNTSTTVPFNDDIKVIKTRHRRSSTLPTHRRRNKFASMQYNLHPFDSEPVAVSALKPKSHHHQSLTLSKSLSFQLAAKNTLPLAATKGKIYPHSEVGLVSSEWECGVLDFVLAADDNHAPNRWRRGGNKDLSLDKNDSLDTNDDGYESDPEFFCRENKTKEFSDPHAHSISHQTSYTLQEFLNERSTFILHMTASKSIAVHVWIELGQQLFDSLVLPKLCWRPILSSPDNTNEVTRKTSIAGGNVSSTELLNICRIRHVDFSDPAQYPFAQIQRLFSIQSTENSIDSNILYDSDTTTRQQHTLTLEARSIADRIRYTNLLKLTISTLAAKFITNDPNALTMFFHNPTISDYVS